MRKSIIERLCRVAFVVISKEFGADHEAAVLVVESRFNGKSLYPYAIGPDEVISTPVPSSWQMGLLKNRPSAIPGALYFGKLR